MATTPRTRAELHNRTTTYEIVAVLPTGAQHRLGFTARISKRTLLGLAQDHAETLLPHLGGDDSASYTAAGGLRLGAVTVRKSGRTERECSPTLAS